MILQFSRSLIILLVAFAAAASAQQAQPEMRVWTAVNGQKFQARLTGTEGAMAIFMLANGQSTKVVIQHLSAADAAFIRAAAATKPGTLPTAKQRAWPQSVEVPSNSVEITAGEQDAAKRSFVYKSKSFEFVSQDKLAGSVMKEVARTFEATRTLVNELPWGVAPKPPADLGFYRAKFYVTREDYIADGGPANSGGVYFSKDRIFRIPFPSLGLQLQGKTWFKKPEYSGDVIIHEVTHQMMHDFLPFLPKWVVEGTAEYTSSLPYNAGRFLAGSHSRAVKQYVQQAAARHVQTSGFRPFGEHLAMKEGDWDSLSANPTAQHLLYFQSYLLVYYFCHLDGDGKGTRFLKYLDSIAEARDAWEEFFKKPEVNRRPDGSFSWPGNISPPAAKMSEEYGLGKLDILLDGRTPAALDAEIHAAFRKIGIKL